MATAGGPPRLPRGVRRREAAATAQVKFTALQNRIIELEQQGRMCSDADVYCRLLAIMPVLAEVSARRRSDTAVSSRLEVVMRNVAMHMFDVPMGWLQGLTYKDQTRAQRGGRGQGRRGVPIVESTLSRRLSKGPLRGMAALPLPQLPEAAAGDQALSEVEVTSEMSTFDSAEFTHPSGLGDAEAAAAVAAAEEHLLWVAQPVRELLQVRSAEQPCVPTERPYARRRARRDEEEHLLWVGHPAQELLQVRAAEPPLVPAERPFVRRREWRASEGTAGIRGIGPPSCATCKQQ
ncbi:unnamed protein product [Prorocentrum cordatum]|uniref:Uncharacterized protein n=1 Tax=Prorocentrum cordatum TaxID=2364126 RepID=A0ABN9T430_9DINO|nr:unnamed protein product [Polarella glacialis]